MQQLLIKYFDTFSFFAIAFFHQKLNIRNIVQIARQRKMQEVRKLRNFKRFSNLAIAQSHF